MRQSQPFMPARDIRPSARARKVGRKVRLDPGEFTERCALHLRDRLADMMQHPLLLIVRKLRPGLRAQDAVQAGDHQVRPLVAFAFQHDLGDRQIQVAGKLPQCRAFGDELAAKHRREQFQNEPVLERDHEIGPGSKRLHRIVRQAMAARDIGDRRLPQRGVRTPGAEGFGIGQGGSWTGDSLSTQIPRMAPEARRADQRFDDKTCMPVRHPT